MLNADVGWRSDSRQGPACAGCGGVYQRVMPKMLLTALAWLLMGAQAASEPRVVATAVAIDPDDPAHDRIGRLRYLGGWALASRDRRFGGYSALHVDGADFLAVADTGDYLRFRMATPGVIETPRFGRLAEFPGRLGQKGDSDSESMAIDPATGAIWIGFEQYGAIFRYAAGFGGPVAQNRPSAMRLWPKNEGAESLVRLSDGRFVVLSEDMLLKSGAREALLFPGDPTDPANVPVRFGYVAPPGYKPTDAAQLPDGRLVVLNRHFAPLDGMWAALTIIDPRRAKFADVLTGELIAELRPPLTIDNMEGISVTREGGRTILWIISDDNQSMLQRTLLMKFALEDAPKR